jgi:DNA-binding CsgD family transcriptional regulator
MDMTDVDGLHDIVASIYACACVDDSWEPALEALRTELDGSAVCLRIHETRGASRDYLTSVGEFCTNEKTREWELRAERQNIDTDCNFGEVRIVNWSSIELDNEMISELKAIGISETLYHCFAKSERSSFTLAITRNVGDRPFDQEDIGKLRHLGKHFGYAVELHEKHFRHSLSGQHQAAALDQLNIAGILVDRFGSVIPLNQTATDLLDMGDSLHLCHGKLTAALRSCNVRLQDILKKVMSGRHGDNATYALAIERRSEQRPLGVVIHATTTKCPVSNRMENSALIFARDPETSFETDPLLLQKLFSFTPAEANLAIGLAKGQPLKEIEDSLHIRHNTARAHLRAMFSKAEVTRQAELVSLLTNSVAPLGRKQITRN